MNAVWLVRGRQLASRMRFWTAIVGYDSRDRSVSHRIYLLYLFLFFSLWGFAVLALFADWCAGLLSLVNSPPVITSILILSLLLVGDLLFRCFRYAQRSPFVFSEDDAVLICLTPVDRSQVAFAWMIGDWFPALLPYVVLAVVLCFSNIQLTALGPLEWRQLPIYWLAGIRISGIVTLLHLAMVSAAFAFGALRLAGNRDYPRLRWVPVGFGLVLLIMPFLIPGLLRLVQWPVLFYPLDSGFGASNLPIGLAIAALLGLTGLLVLRISTRRLNLSRCAQESHTIWGYPGNTLLFNSDITRKAKLRQRLGAGHSASRIPGRTGVASLLWKDLVISLRTAGFSQLWGWLGIFFTMLGMMIAPVWEIRLIALLFWVYLVGKVATHRLRSDLELWVLFRQLPYRPQAALINELARPVITATCLAWLGFGCSCILRFFPPVILLLLLPGIILGVALLSARDVLRRCNCINLISGQVADLGARGVFLSLVFASSPLIVTLFIFPILGTSVIWLTSFGGLLLAYGLPIFLLKHSQTVFQKIS